MQDTQDEKMGFSPSVKKGTTLKVLISRYLKFCATTKSEGTTQKARFSLSKLLEYKGDVLLTTITEGFVDDYVAQRLKSVKPITVKTQMGSIRACFNQAVRWSLIKSNPWNGKRVQVVKEVPEYLKVDEVARFLAEIRGSDLEPLVKFYLFSGCRRSEPLTLLWSDVNLEAGEITLRGAETKTRTARVLSFRQLPQLGELMKTLPRKHKHVFTQVGKTTGKAGNIYDPTTVTQRVKRVFRKLGFDERYSLHSLRKTWTTFNLLGGMPIHMVQAIGGWKSITTLEESYSALLQSFGTSKVVVKLPY